MCRIDDAKLQKCLDGHLGMCTVWTETKPKLMSGQSSGKDGGPSLRRHEFDSRTGYHKLFGETF